MRSKLLMRLDPRGRALGANPSDDRAVMARAVVYLLSASGTLGLLALALPPYADASQIPGVLATSLGCLALGLIVVVRFDKLALWAFHAVLAAGTLLSSATIAVVGTGGPEVFYLWAALYAAFFFCQRGAAGHVILIAASYATVLALDPAPGAVDGWIMTLSGVVLVVLLVRFLRGRIEGLIERLSDAAQTDPLTCLLNRRGFAERFEIELERARRTARPLTLVVGDLDDFKQLNDRRGHQAGDEALARVGELIRSRRRFVDVAARIGGEEFAIALPDTDDLDALHLADRLRECVRDDFDERGERLTMSFGIATLGMHGQSAHALLKAADEALYAAKHLGRDRTVVHSVEVATIFGGRRQDSQQEMQLATALTLAEALDLRDAGTARHSQTVGRYCELMARALDLPPERVERVRLAGVLHDIGKIGVPDSILRKPGPLTDAEWAEMRRHPDLGARLLPGKAFDDVRTWVRAHHERPDGTGYPRGLSAAEIPLEAAILAVADAYEAMTADRPYRDSLGADRAREELVKNAGTQFDRRVVDALLGAIPRFEPASPPEARSAA